MKKLIVLFTIVTGFSMMAKAQDKDHQGKFKISAGGELGFIVGANSDKGSVGLGANAQAEYFFKEKLSFIMIGGFNIYAGKEAKNGVNYNFKNITIIPLKVGARYYLTDGFYGGFQMGIGFISGAINATSFAYSPLIGYTFTMKNDKSFDVSLKYDGYAFENVFINNAALNGYGYGGSLGAVGLRIAYVF